MYRISATAHILHSQPHTQLFSLLQSLTSKVVRCCSTYTNIVASCVLLCQARVNITKCVCTENGQNMSKHSKHSLSANKTNNHTLSKLYTNRIVLLLKSFRSLHTILRRRVFSHAFRIECECSRCLIFEYTTNCTRLTVHGYEYTADNSAQLTTHEINRLRAAEVGR